MMTLKKSKTKMYMSGLVLFFTISVQADTLVEWSSAGLTGGFVSNPVWSNSVAASGIYGAKSIIKLDESKTNSSYYAHINQMSYQLMNNKAMDLNRYIQVFAVPAPGFAMSLTEFSFNLYSTATGAKNVAIRSSIDGFAVDLLSTNLNLGAQNRYHITLPASFSAQAGSVEFRIYIWNATGYQIAYLNDGASTNSVRIEGTVSEQVIEPQPDAFDAVYTGFYRGSHMDQGLYQFTDLTDPVGSSTRIGSWPFPGSNWQKCAFDGDFWYVLNRGTTFGGPGLNRYDGATSLPQISGSTDFSDWHGIGACNQVFYGLYHGAGQSGQGLYLFADPADPFGTGIRLFAPQSFASNVWNDVSFDGERWLFVRNSFDGGIAGIYEYNSTADSFMLISGTETYADWDGLGVLDDDLAPRRNHKLYVLLFGGQSNALGWGYHQYLVDEGHPLAVPQNDVDLFYEFPETGYLPEDSIIPLQSGAGITEVRSGTQQYPGSTAPVCRFGPELSMARTVRDFIQIPDSKVAVIKFAVGGTSLYDSADWRPDGTADRSADGNLYKIFQQTAWKGLSALRNKYPHYEVEVLGMGWVQGESDAIEGQGADYQANLTTLIQDARLTFNTNLTFVLSKISPNQIEGISDTNELAQWPIVRAAQDAVAVADSNVAVTETTGRVYAVASGYAEGRYHYFSSGLLQIGEDLGRALFETSGLDVDEDGLPDIWEKQYGEIGDFSAQGDDDGDGISDLEEYCVGTDPNDSGDQLSLQNDLPTLSWTGQSGLYYQMMFSSNLLVWENIKRPVLAAVSDQNISIDLSAFMPTNLSGFFRLQVQ